MNWTSNAMRRGAGAVAVLAIASATACSDFLEVQDPGRFTDESLNTPIALAAVANGAESDMWAVYDDFAMFNGLLSDEMMHVGTWQQWDDMDKGKLGPAIGTDNGVHSTMTVRRTAAQKAQERFETVMPDSANRTELMARMLAVEGWLNLMLGMHACESPKEANGDILTDVQMYELAIPVLTEAITVAKAASSPDYERFATAGRARAKLLSGDLAGALADAQTIPDAWKYVAKFSETNGPNSTIAQLSYATRLKAGSLDQVHWAEVDTVAGYMKDPWTGALDKRLAFSRRGLSANGITPNFNQEKFKNLGDDINMASGWEMRLIEAEVHMRQNNLGQALTLINKVRANAQLAAINPTTAADVQKALLYERFAQLFLEGHRANDLYRFNLVTSILGPGRATKFAMNTDELNLNPNTNGNTAGRCPTRS